MQVSEAIKIATDKLSSAGVSSPSVDAELLSCFVLGIARSELTLQVVTEQTFPDDKLEKFFSVLDRREKREPLQHITGTAAFRHLELEVGPGVFIPRPETEQLVELAIKNLEGISAPVIVDLCSGSGAIAISLFTELEGANVYSVELSSEAFGFLTRNYQKYGLDLASAKNEHLSTALEGLQGKVDLVISNPPYIPDAAIPLELEVQLHEPSLALYGGQDGLDVIRQISTRALYLLKPGGLILLEHADTQAGAISELLLISGWQEVVSRQDLSGKNRMILARKPQRL